MQLTRIGRTSALLAVLCAVVCSAQPLSHSAQDARRICDAQQKMSAQTTDGMDWVSRTRLAEAFLIAAEDGIEKKGPYVTDMPDRYTTSVHNSRKSSCVMAEMGLNPSIMDFMTAAYQGKYGGFPVTASSAAYVEASGDQKLEQDFASALACYNFGAGSHTAPSFRADGRCNIVAAQLDFAVYTADDPLGYTAHSDVSHEPIAAPWSTSLKRYA